MKHFKRICFIAFLFNLLVMPVMSIPADPRPQKYVQPDGTEISVVRIGDENGYAYYTDDGHPLKLNAVTGFLEPSESVQFVKVKKIKSDIRKSPGLNKIRISDFPTIGEPHSLVILVEFSDAHFSTIPDAKEYYNGLLNENGFTYDNGAHGSVADYYRDASNGAFTPHFDVVGPVRLSRPASYYGGDRNYYEDGLLYADVDTCVADMVVEACKLADSLVDFSQYDEDHDGKVDNIYFFYAGFGEADSNMADVIWPHSNTLDDGFGYDLKLDGITISRYACSNEIRYGSQPLMPVGIGTFVHEFGHVLGLLDHYDPSYNSGRTGVSAWDTMAAASYNDNQNTPPTFSAFERAELGWLKYDDISFSEPGVMSLCELADSNKAYRMIVPDTDGKEFFVFENRQQKSWDETLPGHGMLIWHVDQTDGDLWLKNKINVDGQHQCLDIVEADGIENAGTYDADPFPGTDNITYLDVKAWTGKSFSLDSVIENDGNVKFILGGTGWKLDDVPLNLLEVHGTSIKFTWSRVADAMSYIVRVEDEANNPLNGYNNLVLSDVDTLVIRGLMPQSHYTIYLTASAGSYKSDTSVQDVATTEMEFCEMQPQNVHITNVTSTSFTVNWNVMPDADGYLVTLSEKEFSNPVSEVYDFSEGIDNMPDGWSATSKTLNHALYGESGPSLQLGNTDDCIMFDHPEAKYLNLKFWQRSQSSKNVLHIEQFNDGEWTEVQSVIGSSKGETVNVPLDNYCPIRIRMERKSGYVVIDDVCVEYCQRQSKPIDDMTDIPVSGTSYTFYDLDSEKTYGVSVKGDDNGQVSLSSEEIEVLLSDGTGINVIDNGEEGMINQFYNISGMRVQKPTHGIYITKDGKKLLIK